MVKNKNRPHLSPRSGSNGPQLEKQTQSSIPPTRIYQNARLTQVPSNQVRSYDLGMEAPSQVNTMIVLTAV